MKRIISMILVVLMVATILPISVIASSIEDSLPKAKFTVIDNDKSTLAPGVTMNELVLHNKNNERVEMYVTTVDTALDTIKVMANYMDNQNSVYGMQPLSAQVAALEAKKPEPFKVVAGINASYYNINNGKPTGAFVMEGVDVTTEAEGNKYSFFAVLKDGTYMIGAAGEYSSYKGQIEEAIGGYIHLVKDGEVVNGLDQTTLYPRQTLGLTADGKLVLMTADGSQAPVTVGITIQEQAEIMLELGCVEAIHLDGGNSLTFGAIREGEDTFETINSPSGGAERAVSNTLVIVSTAVADGTFDHAVIKGDYEYYAPHSSYTFTAFGVDASNAAAEIPETVVWTLSDDSFGTIEGGKFISSGKLGQVDIQMSNDGKVVGSKTISVVHPTAISFAADEATVPYGKTAALTVNATYGNYAMNSTAEVYDFVITPATAGTLDGFMFTANNDESVKNATVTAKYRYADDIATASLSVKFGKGSEVLFDFEDGDISDWKGSLTVNEWIEEENAKYPDAKHPILTPEEFGNNIGTTSTDTFLASKENGGAVKSGDYSLGVRIDKLNTDGVGAWVYNYLFYTGDLMIWRDVANGKGAVRVGMWVNMSQNDTNTAFRICRTFTKDKTGKLYTNYDYMTSDYDGSKVTYNTNYAIPESGWIYIYFDLTAYDFQSSLQYNPNENYAANNGKGADGNYYPGFIQFINGTTPGDDTMKDVVLYIDDITLDYSEVTDDRDAPVISETTVCYDTANFVEINGQTVNNNLLSFSAKVSDVSGNSNMTGINYATAKIYVDGIDVSGNSNFKANGGYISLNDIYLTNGKHSIAFVVCDNQGNETRVTKYVTVNGSATNSVVSIAGRNDGNNIPKAGSVYYVDITASDAAAIKEIVTILKMNAANTFEYKNLICADGVTVTAIKDSLYNELTLTITHDGSLSGEAVLVSIPVRVWSWDEVKTGIPADKQFATDCIPVIDIECKTLYGAVTYADNTYSGYVCGFYSDLDVATELDNRTAWHKHNTAAIADKAATCIQSGYIGRTYCEDCASVIEWGTTVPATGHTYKISGNKIACDCGDIDTENGLHNINGVNYYVLAGELASGWITIEEEWYYFDKTNFAGVDGDNYADGDIKFTFDNGRIVTGAWVRNSNGLRYWYGPGYYRDTSLDPSSCRAYEIDGKTYLFSRQGYVQTGIAYWMYRLLGTTGETLYYDCGTDGVATLLTGPYNGRFYKDGKILQAYQLVQFNGDYYFVSDGHKFAKDTTIYLTSKYVEGYTFEDGTPLGVGYYTFDSEGKMVVKNGVVDGYLYINGVQQKAYQLVEYNGDYYFVGDYHKVVTNAKVWLTSQYVEGYTFEDGTPLGVGYYTFDSEGKMVVKNGVVDGYLYINGVQQKAYQLVEYNGDYYFVGDNHKVVTNAWVGLTLKYVADKTFADGSIIGVGNYYFDETGKMVY